MGAQRRFTPPIAEYGLIGDGRTAALCSAEGSIDWLCVPRFDSEPVFGKLVGGERAGCFSLRVDDVQETTRGYREGSAVLETRWRTSTGAVGLTEGMVLDVERRLLPQVLLVRRLECSGAPVSVHIRFDPRTGLTGPNPQFRQPPRGLITTRGSLAMALQVAPQVKLDPGRETTVLLEPARPLTMALSVADREPLVFVSPDEAFRSLEETDRWWRTWRSRITYRGPAAASVLRSLITLRLLTYSPSGAPVAAPTTSLPEEVGGERNSNTVATNPNVAHPAQSTDVPLRPPDRLETTRLCECRASPWPGEPSGG
jgi:GH15 family glucan-1,4-alpha-glucosidase